MTTPDEQSSWVLTASLTKLRDGFNVAFPTRDKGSDGSIGDDAHQQTTSGHNPDDTAGVKAEYSDPDSKAEVRAIDVDCDLNSPDVTMQDVIDEILGTPNDTKRLKYIIYNRTEWSKSNGWIPEYYDGSNPHDRHAHFSGDPNYDEDTSVWSVAYMGDDMAYSESEMAAFPWQYTGRGIGENDTGATRSTLSYFDEVLDTVRAVKATLNTLATTIPPDLIDRLDAILLAAQDDGQMDVVLPPDAMETLQQIVALLETLPTAEETADAVWDEGSDRLTE